jgi:hypothetical protein
MAFSILNIRRAVPYHSDVTHHSVKRHGRAGWPAFSVATFLLSCLTQLCVVSLFFRTETPPLTQPSPLGRGGGEGWVRGAPRLSRDLFFVAQQ